MANQGRQASVFAQGLSSFVSIPDKFRKASCAPSSRLSVVPLPEPGAPFSQARRNPCRLRQFFVVARQIGFHE